MLHTRLGKADGRQDMRHFVSLCAMVVAGSAHGDIQEYVRYEVDLAVVSNTVQPSTSNDLASLTVGTAGSLTFDVLNDSSIFPSSDPQHQSYQILDTHFTSGNVSTSGAQGVYPSSNMFHGVQVLDNSAGLPAGLRDTLFIHLFMDHPDFSITSMDLSQTLVGDEPTLIQGLDLPLSMDTSLINGDQIFVINSSAGPSQQIRYGLVDLRIEYIPTPGTSALLALTGLAAMRRRR